MKTIIISTLLSLVALACKNTERSDKSGAEPSGMVLAMPEKEKSFPADNATPTDSDQKIIRDANLRFETGDLEATYAQIRSSVKKYDGIIQQDSQGKDYESVFRNITVRVPCKYFDAFIADAGKSVSYFDNKQISARDVTTEFIDTEARLKAKKSLEARYFELLKKATKVSEILEIEKQLATVREEIEAKEGQLKYLQSQISMSTVAIEFYKKTAMEGGATISYGSKMWNAIKSGFNGISTFFIGLLYIWPFIVILVVLIFVLRKRMRRKKIV